MRQELASVERQTEEPGWGQTQGRAQGLFAYALGPRGPEKGALRLQLIKAGSKSGRLINGNCPPAGADQSSPMPLGALMMNSNTPPPPF